MFVSCSCPRPCGLKRSKTTSQALEVCYAVLLRVICTALHIHEYCYISTSESATYCMSLYGALISVIYSSQVGSRVPTHLCIYRAIVLRFFRYLILYHSVSVSAEAGRYILYFSLCYVVVKCLPNSMFVSVESMAFRIPDLLMLFVVVGRFCCGPAPTQMSCHIMLVHILLLRCIEVCNIILCV